jgi:hypothetical protein
MPLGGLVEISLIGPIVQARSGRRQRSIFAPQPSTAQRDRTQRLSHYAAAGTPELWLVCGLNRSVTRFVHDGRGFCAPTVAHTELTLAILPDVVIPFAGLW